MANQLFYHPHSSLHIAHCSFIKHTMCWPFSFAHFGCHDGKVGGRRLEFHAWGSKSVRWWSYLWGYAPWYVTPKCSVGKVGGGDEMTAILSNSFIHYGPWALIGHHVSTVALYLTIIFLHTACILFSNCLFKSQINNDILCKA